MTSNQSTDSAPSVDVHGSSVNKENEPDSSTNPNATPSVKVNTSDDKNSKITPTENTTSARSVAVATTDTDEVDEPKSSTNTSVVVPVIDSNENNETTTNDNLDPAPSVRVDSSNQAKSEASMSNQSDVSASQSQRQKASAARNRVNSSPKQMNRAHARRSVTNPVSANTTATQYPQTSERPSTWLSVVGASLAVGLLTFTARRRRMH